MPKLKPVGDVFMVEIGEANNLMGLVGGPSVEDGVREGRVVDISNQLTYYGMATFAFDKSLNDKDLLKDIYNHFKQYVGKRVCWSERNESGSIIMHEGKTYAFIKFSAIMGVYEND